MPQYSYSTDPLDSGSIRLLGLMPAKDMSSPIHCRLHDYSLRESDRGIHLYEALSYVWGSPENPKVVYINNRSLSVTANLYTALLHLRDRAFERVMWVDSICINQEDNTEKGQQIQLMAKIYGQANRVIVYLGDEADDSNQALESIRVAAQGDTPKGGSSEGGFLDRGVNEMNHMGVSKLLKRPWFERIWVLQEVGFAQQILIMCGSATIDGYTFSTGFSKLFYNRHSELLNLIRPVMYLIREAIFRPKHAIMSSGVLSLGELMDMYHIRMATKLHDKVYALLSMSSDTHSLAGLSPDYKVTWQILLERLVKFVFSENISVMTWDGKTKALIESKGYVFGHVRSVDVDSTKYERQCIYIEFNNSARLNDQLYRTCWILRASAKSIQRGDLVCFFNGALKPTIIRAYKNHFAIIVIAVTLQDEIQRKGGSFDSSYALPPMKKFLRDFLLIWDWEQSPENLPGQTEDEGTIEKYNLVAGYLTTDANKAVNSINVALALADAGNHEHLEDLLQEQMENYEAMLGGENLHILTLNESLAWMYYQKHDMIKAENSFLQVIETRKSFQGRFHEDTLSTLGKLGLVYMDENSVLSLEWRDIIRLSDQIESNSQISEEDMIQIGKLFNHKTMKFWLEQMADKCTITEKVVKAAARNQQHGYEIMKLLLEKRGEEIRITEEVVKSSIENSAEGYEIMKLLLKERGEEIRITEEVIKSSIRNSKEGCEIMELLFEKRDKELTITEEVVETAATHPWSGCEIMNLLFQKRGKEITITEELLEAAVENKFRGYKLMELLFEKRDEEIRITENIVKTTAENLFNGGRIMELLLEKRDIKLTITEEVIVIASSNGNDGYEILEHLLGKQREKVVITEKVVKAAAANVHLGNEIIKLMLEKRGEEVIIPEEIVVIIASKFDANAMALLLEKQRDRIVITEEIMKAAAGNSHYGQEITMLVLEKRGEEVIIPEEIVVIIASKFDANAMALLLEKQRDRIVITEEIMKAAAGNSHYGQELIMLLLEERGEEVIVTEGIVKAAVGNHLYGEDIIMFLLEKRSGEVTITEGVLEVAERRSRLKKEVMELLLEHQATNVVIPERMVQTATKDE